MQTVPVEEAVGSILCHDITRIVPGEFKGPAFRKGHIIAQEDIPELLRLGKKHLYVWQPHPDLLHEDDAAVRLAQAVCGPGLSCSDPQEGKVNLIATAAGMCCIDEAGLLEINMVDEIVAATRANRRLVQKGDIIAGLRVVPLVINKHKLEKVEAISQGRKIIQVKPFLPYKTGIVTTGSEVYAGCIEDKFGPVLQRKLEACGCSVTRQILVPDDIEKIKESIHTLIGEGAQMILVTGGMSVDPDDVTPRAVQEAGANVVSYGAPVLPGSMLMVAYIGDVPILGLPGCVMYNRYTVFDLILPTVLTGEKISRAIIARLGLGGLCLNCPVCHYPSCSFGTGL